MTTNYNINWTNNITKPPFALQAGVINDSVSSLSLSGRGVINWGERIQENVIRLLEHFASPVPPLNPTIGQIWFNSNTNSINFFYNNVWNVIASTTTLNLQLDGQDTTIASLQNLLNLQINQAIEQQSTITQLQNLLNSHINSIATSGTHGSIPTYSITPSSTSVNEDGTVLFTVNTTFITNGTTLYYTLNSTSGVNNLDFTTVDNGSLVINGNSAVIVKSLSSDLITEGQEFFQLALRTTNITGPIVAYSAYVSINDTSIDDSPPAASYGITSNSITVNEGATVTFTIQTENVTDGTTLYWSTTAFAGSNSTINASDFLGDELTGSVIINSNTGTITRTVRADLFSEGSESFFIQLHSQPPASLPILAISPEILIFDTSTTPADVYVPTGPLIYELIMPYEYLGVGEGRGLSTGSWTALKSGKVKVDYYVLSDGFGLTGDDRVGQKAIDFQLFILRNGEKIFIARNDFVGSNYNLNSSLQYTGDIDVLNGDVIGTYTYFWGGFNNDRIIEGFMKVYG